MREVIPNSYHGTFIILIGNRLNLPIIFTFILYSLLFNFHLFVNATYLRWSTSVLSLRLYHSSPHRNYHVKNQDNPQRKSQFACPYREQSAQIKKQNTLQHSLWNVNKIQGESLYVLNLCTAILFRKSIILWFDFTHRIIAMFDVC